MISIGERIQKERKLKRLSLSELAERASVAKSYLSNVERGIQKNPSIQFIEKVAAALHVSVNFFLMDDLSEAVEQLDQEWFDLVKDAMSSGVSKDEFKEFVQFQKWKQHGQASQHPIEENAEKK